MKMLWKFRVVPIYLLSVSFVILGCQSVVHRRETYADLAMEHFEKNVGPAKKCADDLIAQQGVKEGLVTVEWMVNDKGEVSRSHISKNTLGTPSIGNCFIGLLQQLRFPKANLLSQNSLSYTFRWTSAQKTQSSH